ncbi:aspartate--tRNA ligase [Kosmotoga pacifica]|uniref:Aspartate--tRNA ligase n=1 Tax=Kosmotoga pacifica TaxID=1330330 RepID=A0A0G2Z583_9BACT|nr:aspartate--tRNA ligase [Kosmotoga pacifica]AKI96775.1 aspartyl-tRNA synthetase [Kosmotoga pacifica]
MEKRTHNCGELRKKDVGKEVVLNGWVDRIRDLGGIKFVLLRDRYGYTQVVFNPEDKELYEKALSLSPEYVISIRGKVMERPQDAVNPKMPTGEIEVHAVSLSILSESQTPPIYVNIDDESSEELRLKYRYLDLRRPKMQRNLILRHKVVQAIRRFLNNLDFLEIETPVLTKSTPEGARDFLVPSRLKPGKFYALPQSPQLFKQLLMVAGLDRYYQIVKCYRDEDFRADRQPEFTQVDLEMSFVDEEDVFEVVEGMLKAALEEATGIELPDKFDRMTYDEAIDQYGSDRPDRRYGMELHDITDIFKSTGFRVISSSIETGGVVRAFKIQGLASRFTRKLIDQYTELAKSQGLGGLIWIKIENELKSSILKFCGEEVQSVAERLGAMNGDIIFVAVGERELVSKALGKVREKVIAEELPVAEGIDILWITEFPMFSFNEEEKRIEAEHHPFTMPDLNDLSRYKDTNPLKIKSRAYDLVINGYEIGSGSVRIHRQDIQNEIFKLIGLSDEEANKKFGFLLEAFKYGPPPHAGIALGLDRLVAILAGANSIRDVIAFPKTASGSDPMTGAPSEVSQQQLKELKLMLMDGRGE